MSKPFKLSSILYGHSLDVRSIVCTPDNSIISGSRDKTAKYWKSNVFNAGYTDTITYKDQKNFVASVLYLNPTAEYPDGLIVTGGNDNTILIYKPSEPFATFKIQEHTDVVCCLSNCLDTNSFLSGSWDKTAKVWSLNNLKASVVTFSGHAAAIWSVIQISNSNVVTACADRTIGVWLNNGQKIKSLTGHKDCVRGVCDFPDLKHFLSVSNDASIKVWSYDGENLETLYGHTNYIYSIARCSADGSNSFATCDEDRTVRYWKDGANVQAIHLPAQSIWTIAALPNGDIVTGSSDGMIRIFTQNESRMASPETIKQFEEEVEALFKQSCQEIGGYKVSDLPGREALYDPGKSAGQMKMIREAGGVVAYTWVDDGDNSHWEKVGDVIGSNDKANEGKTMYEGQAYDFVFSVDVEDGKPPLKLPYNKGEDVYEAANKFLSKYNLPAVYLDQVVDFIHKNAQGNEPMVVDNNYQDPFTGATRYTPTSVNSGAGTAGTNLDPLTGGSSYVTSSARPMPSESSTTSALSGPNMDPFTGASSYTTQNVENKGYFPHTTYLRFDAGDPKVILNKLKEFNQKVDNGLKKVDDAILEEVVTLCTESCANNKTIDRILRLLEWPSDIIFPVIDVVRLAVRDEVNNNLLALHDCGSIINVLKNQLSKDSNLTNNILVSFRALCNFFIHPSGEELIHLNRNELLESLTSISSSNKNIQIAMATFLLNLTILTMKRKDEVGLILLASVVPDTILNLSDAEAQFRAFVALGTLITINEMLQKRELKAKILENSGFIIKLQQLSTTFSNDLESKRMKCAAQVQKELLQ